MTSDPDIHAFQGIVTKLRTTRGSIYALDVMAEAADEIERLHEALDREREGGDQRMIDAEPNARDEILSRSAIFDAIRFTDTWQEAQFDIAPVADAVQRIVAYAYADSRKAHEFADGLHEIVKSRFTGAGLGKQRALLDAVAYAMREGKVAG